MKIQKNNWKRRSFKEFLLITPFLVLVLIFSYYPLYGWTYAFFDYQPPLPFSWDSFVGLKWFKLLFQSRSYIRQTLQVLRNTFAMSGISLAFSWLPMFFAIMLNEIRVFTFQEIRSDRYHNTEFYQLGTCLFRCISINEQQWHV